MALHRVTGLLSEQIIADMHIEKAFFVAAFALRGDDRSPF
jgi:hypothetical protein